MKIYDVSRLPSMIKIGWDGENNWRPNAFDCSSLLKNHPNGVITLWLLPKGETQAFPVALERDGNTVVWTPLSEEMTAATGALQLVCTDGTDVGKSAVSLFRVGESIIPGADHPAAVPSWATQTMEQMQSAVEHYPTIIDSTWHVWDVENETWEDTGVSAQGVDGEDGHSPYIALNGHWMVYSDSTHEWIDTGVPASVDEAVIANAVAAYLDEHPITVTETDPTVPAWAKQPDKPTYTAQEVGALPADTPIPAAVTEQTVAGWGFTKNTGTYSKPSGGIPTSDLNLVDLRTWLDDVGAIIDTLSLSGTTITLDESFLDVYSVLVDSARQNLFILPIGGTTQNPVVLILSLQKADAQTYSITLGGEYNGNRYSVTLSAASVNASSMTGTLVVEPIVTESDIPTAVSELTNDSGYQTAAQVQTYVQQQISAIPDELPTVSASDNGKFLRVVSGAWAAQAVPAAESNSFGGGS